jgi:hypothetical protein
MNTNKLLVALEDERNDNLLDFNSHKLKEMIFKILKELHLSKKNTLDIFKKLNNYKYVNEVKDLKYGTFIRWIPIEDYTNIQLSKKAAIFCEVIINEKGIFCLCKNFGYNSKYFQIDMGKNLLFQKLTDQELVLLSALDHLSSK